MRTEETPIFIVGAPRSGTTLLQYMLKSHPDISLPTGESHFFIPFYQRRNEFGDLSLKDNLRSLLSEIYHFRKDFFDDDFHGVKFDIIQLTDRLFDMKVNTVPQVIGALFELNAKAEGKKFWGEKTPYYILHLDTILEMFPQAKVVHIIRDGRDCALSMLDRRWDLRIFNIYHAAYIWDKYVQAGLKFKKKYPDSYFEIKYESLIKDPIGVAQPLCNFLTIDYSDDLINFKKSSQAGKTPLLTKPLNSDNTQKWKSEFSKKDIKVFEALAAETLVQCDYELAYFPGNISKIDWFVNELHIKLCNFYCKYILD